MYLLGLLLYNFLFRATQNNFDFYWGIPTSSCKKFQVDFMNLSSNHGIIQNNNDSIRGDKVVVMYDPGLWPTLITSQNGQITYQNGGLPQNASIDLHLRQFEVDVDRFIPNRTYDGIAVIDFECWRPTFRQNFGDLKIYRDLTLLAVQKKHPSWTRDQVESQGKIIFENSSFNFVNRTIMKARRIRPNAKWGFYGYPLCFNRLRDDGQIERCPEQVEGENNKLTFMYPEVIYPSIYITQNQTGSTLTSFVKGKMYETNRLAKLSGSNLKLAFIRYQYTDTMNMMKNEDMINILKTVKSEGGNGVIIWGSSSQFKTEVQCQSFKSYFDRDFLQVISDFKKLRKL